MNATALQSSSPSVERIGDAELWLGDCREILSTIGKVAAVVTDPPYGIGESAKKNRTRGGGGGRLGMCAPTDYGDDDWDQEPCPPDVLAWMRKNSRWQIVFGGNYFPLPPSSCWLVWDKENTGDFADAELAWTNLPKAVRLKRHMWNGGLRKGREERFHLTQKPLAVMQWALSHLPDLGGGIVLDPFMGSGTTGVACALERIRFIGIEREQRHFDTARRRIEEAYRQPRLFDEPPPKPIQDTLFGSAEGVAAQADRESSREAS